MISHFELKIYKGNSIDDTPEFEADGAGDDWRKYTRLSFPGFDGAIKLSLEEFWQNVIKNQLEICQLSLEGYETIVKFGDTMQLKEPFTAVLKVNYQ